MKSISTKIIFMIVTLLVVITLCSCSSRDPLDSNTNLTTSGSVITTPTTTEYQWPLSIPYPEHSEEVLKGILSEKYEDFEYDAETFVYISYFDQEKTQYHIYYSYLYRKSFVVSAYVVYVDDGVIKNIEDTMDRRISNSIREFLKIETDESVLEWGFKSDEKLRDKTVYDTFEYVLDRAHSVFNYGVSFFSPLKKFYFMPSWEDKNYVINYDYMDLGEIFVIPLPSKNTQK